MLVVSRKAQESVAIADTGGHSCLVKVTVVEVRGDRVRLGFEANNDVPVHRWEVWQRLVENGDVASGASCGSRVRDVDMPEKRMHQSRLRPGDVVRVKAGALAGIEGTVTRLVARRVVVDISLIQSGVSLEINADLLEPLARLRANAMSRTAPM